MCVTARMYGTDRTELDGQDVWNGQNVWDGHDRLAVIDHLQNIQRAAPSTLKVPQKVLLLHSETFYPTESRLICHRGLSKGFCHFRI